METLNSSSINQKDNQGAVAEDDMEGSIFFARDSILLLNIFPMEVWQLVSEHLSDCEKHNLCNASPFFRKLFFEKRQLFLFCNTLEHLAPYLVRRKEEEGTGSTFLDCRMVCYSWKEAVDCYLADEYIDSETITQFITNDSERKTIQNATRKDFSNDDNGAERTEHFLRLFETQPVSSKARNPFISQTVGIHYFTSFDQNKDFMNAITTLLHKHGEHIQRVSILFYDANLETLYSALDLWLRHIIGKVKFLLIYGTSMIDFHEDFNLPNFSVPKFQNLTILNLDTLPTSILKELVFKNSHNLRTLELNQEFPHSDGNDFVSFPNLKRFWANISSMDQMSNIIGFFENCQLEIIRLHQSEENSDPVHLPCFEILKFCASTWGNSLAGIILYFPSENTAEQKEIYLRESANLRLNFPCLQTFKLEVKSPIHLDFLLEAKNTLNSVIINNSGKSLLGGQEALVEGDVGVDNNPQIVQFLGYENRMYESNIWTLFPKLKTVCTSPNGDQCVFERHNWTGENM